MATRAPLLTGLLAAGPALLLATSCTPNAPLAVAGAAAPPRVADGRALLRRLSLRVPAGLPDQPLPGPGLGDAAALVPPPFLAAGEAPDDAARAADCLTAAVYYEARSEPLDGQRAVAQVVLNRVRDRAFPASVCGVVYQGAIRRRGGGCQFSFACDGSLDRPREPAAWERAQAIAAAALAGSVFAPVGSATYYHANYVLPWWASSLSRVGAIGNHIFYRWAGGLERALAFRQAYAGAEPVIALPAASVAEAGVAVHLGAADGAGEEGGVLVHRGGDAPSPAQAIAAAADATAGADAGAEEAPGGGRAAGRPVTVAGVRVHYGEGGDPG